MLLFPRVFCIVRWFLLRRLYITSMEACGLVVVVEESIAILVCVLYRLDHLSLIISASLVHGVLAVV